MASLFDFSQEDHEDLAGSEIYARMLAKEFESRRKSEAERQALDTESRYVRDRRDQMLGSEADQTGAYAEGISPTQRFLMERRYGNMSSGIDRLMDTGNKSGIGIQNALLRKGESKNKNIEWNEYLESMSGEERRRAIESRRADPWLSGPMKFTNPNTDEEVMKDVSGKKYSEKQAGFISDRLEGFSELMKRADQAKTDIGYTMEQLDKLASITNERTVGVGSLLKYAYRSDATNWVAIKDSIVAQLGLNKLSEMKSLSKTGASGLGQLSEKELKVLQDQLGAINPKSKPEDIKRVLANIYSKLAEVRNKVDKYQGQDIDWYERNKSHLDESNRYDNRPFKSKKYNPWTIKNLPTSFGQGVYEEWTPYSDVETAVITVPPGQPGIPKKVNLTNHGLSKQPAIPVKTSPKKPKKPKKPSTTEAYKQWKKEQGIL